MKCKIYFEKWKNCDAYLRLATADPGFTDNVVAVELTRSRKMRTCATSKRSAKRSAPMVLPSQLIWGGTAGWLHSDSIKTYKDYNPS